MGIPGLYKHIISNYPLCIKKDSLFLKLPHLFFDYNGIIHTIVQNTLKNFENIDISDYELVQHMCNGIVKYTNDIINFIKPEFVYIAMDGVAPRAKMTQQRLRRFKSAKENTNLSRFDKNCISPGTDFMISVEVRLNKYFHHELPKFVKGYKFSDTSEPGEGEHSIINHIRTNYNENKQYVIYGLDADLIMLSMSTFLPKIYLLREIQFFESNYNTELDTDIMQFHFLCIDSLKRGLIKDVERNYHVRIKKPVSFIRDWIFLCFFLGNDFLPHLKSLDIYHNGIHLLLSVYCFFIKKTKQYDNDYLILLNQKINMSLLRKIFNYLDKNEENYIIENIKYHKHKRNKLDDSPIRYCYKGWPNRYYDYYYKTHSSLYIDKIVENYFRTLIWTKEYYFKGCPCWKHYYKYKGILLSYMKEYIMNNDINDITFEENKPYSSEQQLMMILPPESYKLLQDQNQHFMIDPESELIEFYPNEFILEKMDKIREWMYEPILPSIDEKLILKYV